MNSENTVAKDAAYWENYYSRFPHPFNPSAFAVAMAQYVDKPGTLLELGCGNGRDAVFFGDKLNLEVIAVDQCAHEIARLQKEFRRENLVFVAADFSAYVPPVPVQYVYSRWTMHAITPEAEEQTLARVRSALKAEGKLFIEARSIRDDLYGVGRQVAEHAFISDHYRRFMDPTAMTRKLENQGYSIRHSVESRGLAVYKDDDPVIVRIVAEKQA